MGMSKCCPGIPWAAGYHVRCMEFMFDQDQSRINIRIGLLLIKNLALSPQKLIDMKQIIA